MEILQVIIAAVVITILVLGFFAFHIWLRLKVWPETYRKDAPLDEEGEVHVPKKARKKFKPPDKP
jgi:hypothetical protein